MSALLSEDAIVRGLMAAGVPREKAEREAKRQRGATAFADTFCSLFVEPTAPAPIAWPFRLVLPWSHLVSDNQKFVAQLQRANNAEGWRAVMVITDRYARAKEQIGELARSKLAGAEPVAMPLEIVARVFVPDERPHDVTNFSKIVQDALEKILYRNDRWMHHADWWRAGVDVDAPRAEITITPLQP